MDVKARFQIANIKKELMPITLNFGLAPFVWMDIISFQRISLPQVTNVQNVPLVA